MSQPVFVISLDLELGWGFILHPDHKALKLLRNDPQSGRGIVDLLLNLFQRYKIPVTWAVVGHLFLKQGEGKGLISRELPQFRESWLNWNYYSQICDSPLYIAPDIIDKILSSRVGHEIGLHSFFHIPFSMCSQAVAKLDVELGVSLAQKCGIKVRSFVFPENRAGHAETLKEQGIKIYRGNIPRLFNHTTSLLVRKITGALSIVVPPPVIPLWKDGIWELPGSMSFQDFLMPFISLPRAKIGLERAIRTGRLFHIWMHPWKLLQRRSLYDDLEKLLGFVAQERDKGNIHVMTMAEIVVEAQGRRW